MRGILIWALGALVCGVLQVGCGGSSSGSELSGASRSTSTSATSAHHDYHSQPAAPALAACTGAVEKAAPLSASGKRELIDLCDGISDRVRENERIVRAVCQELASATSTYADRSDSRRAFSACYADYAKTVR